MSMAACSWKAQKLHKLFPEHSVFDPESFRAVALLAHTHPRRDNSIFTQIFTHLIFFRLRFCGGNMPAITALAAPIKQNAQPLWFSIGL